MSSRSELERRTRKLTSWCVHIPLPRSWREKLEGVHVVVATEAPSAGLVDDHVRSRDGVVGAYYVQDYEPLFAPEGGPSADTAILSYRRAASLLLFAKTHWVANTVGSAHTVPVAKVSPSLDRGVFHATDRGGDPTPIRVAAMIRPRTPRRRAAETVSALARLKGSLGKNVECLGFGCTIDEFEALPGSEGVECLGVLSREEVAQLLRSCDLFLDMSKYQAFGRTGLEAMACGCVPILPIVGGVTEYAVEDWNALVVDTGDQDQVEAAATALIEDPERLRRLRRKWTPDRRVVFALARRGQPIRVLCGPARRDPAKLDPCRGRVTSPVHHRASETVPPE